MLVRGLYFEGWRMAGTPTQERIRAAFFEHLRHELPSGSAIDPNMAARSVFMVLSQKLDPGQVERMLERLPTELRELWS